MRTPYFHFPRNFISLCKLRSLVCGRRGIGTASFLIEESAMAGCCCRILEILCAILLPPLGVCFRHGCCSLEFFICLVLTVLGYVPGVIYAVYVILCVPPVTDYYVLV